GGDQAAGREDAAGGLAVRQLAEEQVQSGAGPGAALGFAELARNVLSVPRPRRRQERHHTQGNELDSWRANVITPQKGRAASARPSYSRFIGPRNRFSACSACCKQLRPRDTFVFVLVSLTRHLSETARQDLQ